MSDIPHGQPDFVKNAPRSVKEEEARVLARDAYALNPHPDAAQVSPTLAKMKVHYMH